LTTIPVPVMPKPSRKFVPYPFQVRNQRLAWRYHHDHY
jgi:hypothetical protein